MGAGVNGPETKQVQLQGRVGPETKRVEVQGRDGPETKQVQVQWRGMVQRQSRCKCCRMSRDMKRHMQGNVKES